MSTCLGWTASPLPLGCGSRPTRRSSYWSPPMTKRSSLIAWPRSVRPAIWPSLGSAPTALSGSGARRLLIGCGWSRRAGVTPQAGRNWSLQRQTDDEPAPPVLLIRLGGSAGRLDPIEDALRGRLWARPADDLDSQLALLDGECGLSGAGQVPKALDRSEVGRGGEMFG